MENSLTSGFSYSLSELFSLKNKIVIPDLQRDYTWGDNKHGGGNQELVTGFCNDLFEVYKKSKDEEEIQLGIIYAYENPENHINLADGQQRITTMFLLVGMLHRINNFCALKQILIYDFELNKDDQEPNLHYAIRESTLYFLNDLVINYFLDPSETQENLPDEIKKKKWYFSEYDNDPSIQSMIKAINYINKIIKDKNKELLGNFSNWLIKHVKLLYFEMKDRRQGEEMFVIINTTGEPLTPSENLKPTLIGSIKKDKEKESASELWEKWETWFWQNKLENEHEADQGLNQFFIWYWQIKLKQESDWTFGKQKKLNPINLFNRILSNQEIDGKETSSINNTEWNNAIKLESVDEFFEQFIILSKYSRLDSDFQNIFKSITDSKENLLLRNFNNEQALRVVLPLLSFMVKFPNENNRASHYQFLRKLRKNYYDGHKEWLERKINYVDWRHILEIIEKSDTAANVFVFKDASLVSNIDNWFNHEEQLKKQLKKSNQKKIEKWEDDEDFKGDLSPLFRMALVKNEIISIKNVAIELNNDLDEIELLETQKDALVEISIECFEQILNVYKESKNNVWLMVLKIRFSRNNSYWSGNWSFGRDSFTYKRWHPKKKKLLYQNWYYYLLGQIDSIPELDSTFKHYCNAILKQSNKSFFESTFNLDASSSSTELVENIKNMSVQGDKINFYFWNAFLWRFILAIKEPEKRLEYEIVFDLFDRSNNEYEIGNQFIWSKDYYGRTIHKFDNFNDCSWADWNEINKESDIVKNFIQKREAFLIDSIN